MSGPRDWQAIEEQGASVKIKWPLVAAIVRTRTAVQCRERYNNVGRVNPNLVQVPGGYEMNELVAQ